MLLLILLFAICSTVQQSFCMISKEEIYNRRAAAILDQIKPQAPSYYNRAVNRPQQITPTVKKESKEDICALIKSASTSFK